MKNTVLVAIILLINNISYAGSLNIQGQYSYDKSVPVMYIQNKEECLSENGDWLDAEDVSDIGMCLLKGSDKVEVSRKFFQYHLSVETLGSNAHSCSFEGKAKRQKNQLVASVKTEEYNFETDKMDKVICVVKASFTEGKVKITNNGHCQSFCGINAYLETEAEKK